MEKINREVARIQAQPDFRGKLEAGGYEVTGGTVPEVGAYLQTEIAKWTKMVQATGVTPD